MNDMRTLLDREARTVMAPPRAFAAVLRRAERRRRVRVIGTIVVALAVAASGLGVVLVGFDPAPSRPATQPEPRLSRPVRAAWPEVTEAGLERAQEAAERGEHPWRLSETETALRFAAEVLGWRPAEITVERLRGYGSVRLSNPTIEGRFGAPGSTEMLVMLRQLTEEGGDGVWSVVEVEGQVRAVPPRSRISVPGGTTIVEEVSLSDQAMSATDTVRADLFVGPYGDDLDPWETARLQVDDETTARLGPVPEGAGGWAFVLYRALGPGGVFLSARTSLWGPYASGIDVGHFLSEDMRTTDAVADARLRALEGAAVLSGRGVYDTDVLPSEAEQRRFGIERLREEMASDDFRYAEDQTGDPIEYWEGIEADGIPVFEILWGTLMTPFGVEGDIYFWPRSSAKPVDEITDEDLRLILDYGLITPGEVDEWFATGEYPGWRAEISADGTWLSFLDEKP